MGRESPTGASLKRTQCLFLKNGFGRRKEGDRCSFADSEREPMGHESDRWVCKGKETTDPANRRQVESFVQASWLAQRSRGGSATDKG